MRFAQEVKNLAKQALFGKLVLCACSPCDTGLLCRELHNTILFLTITDFIDSLKRQCNALPFFYAKKRRTERDAIKNPTKSANRAASTVYRVFLIPAAPKYTLTV